ncbi:serine/threonine protein kinase [Lujinxingia sediminis]|uniref:Serine/threonine protein kinase n=1 Tax=Lujinxingia sediminis TaxID=2480984 RepID=A0ABY0CND1_9DELT|nr:serine/threonine-protein kinase [Lujinxingia sediminis]RVU41476.1 serine/threonine protein kinase [Lujinxingia sediminis]
MRDTPVIPPSEDTLTQPGPASSEAEPTRALDADAADRLVEAGSQPEVGLDRDSAPSVEAEPSTRAGSLSKGSLIAGRYRLDRPLGDGGMGQVYRAEHVLMRKTVALKVLHAELTENKEVVARFQREAQAAALLDSPHVCQATDFGQTDDGEFFLVMEYLEGQTLHEAMALGKMPLVRAAHIARQIASALGQAHAHGIVHRDLKPENIMLVDREGAPDFVKIMDFGIARISMGEEAGADKPTRLTRKGMVYGTPHYMAPEQIAGAEVDARADLYALGVVLFEMLTGQPPYDDDNVARLMGKHVTHPIPTLRERCPEVAFPQAAERLIARLLAKDADARPESAEALIETIDTLNDSPLTAAIAPIATAAASAAGDSLSSLGQRAIDVSGPLRHRVIKASEPLRERWRTEVLPRWKALSADEQRLVRGLAIGALVMLVSILALTIYVVSGESRAQRQTEASREALMEDPQVLEAIAAARTGDRRALEALLLQNPDDADLRYLALMADLHVDREVDLLEESRSIVAADERYAHDPALVDEVVARFAAGSDDAATWLRDHLTSTSRSAIARVASQGERASLRRRAHAFLEEADALDDLERWERLGVELRVAGNCEDYKEKIDAIVDLDDPRARPTLQAMSDSPKVGCGFLNRRDCIACVRDDLKRALEVLPEP